MVVGKKSQLACLWALISPLISGFQFCITYASLFTAGEAANPFSIQQHLEEACRVRPRYSSPDSTQSSRAFLANAVRYIHRAASAVSIPVLLDEMDETGKTRMRGV